MDQLKTLASSTGADAPRRSASIRRFDELDWDFPAEMSESPFSDLHWHPCRFPSQVPAIVIGRMTAPGDVVLDPFMGSGTTITEAQRLGRASLGIDVNPISHMIVSAKTLPYSAHEISVYVTSVRTALVTEWDSIKQKRAPPSVQMDKWYTPAVQSALGRLWGYIHERAAKSDPLHILLRASFSAILMPSCREVRHWGYICDNSEPKSSRERDPRALFCELLERTARAYAWRERNGNGPLGICDLCEDDAELALASVPDESVHCFVTSPPYFGVTDYVKSQRLSMEWFELDIEPKRQKEIGARSKRHRRTAAFDYINELSQVFAHVYRVLRKNGWGVIVFGQSPKRPSAKEEFVQKIEALGLRLELNKSRQISEMRRQFPSLRDEFVLLVRKA